MRNILFVLFFYCISNAYANEKYALILAIGDYPAKTGWGTISSANDVPLIKQTLLNQAFKEEQIEILLNEQATKKGILKALKVLLKKIKPGDVVVFHVSAHGQQILDDNEDEIDGLDEAIVPYDAWARYTYNYKGENHLRDDEIGVIIANFRNKLGKGGQLLFLLDSCHSGTASRGGKARGTKSAFVPEGWISPKTEPTTDSDMFDKVKLNKNRSPFVLISGAAANELNYEYEGFGSLSYSFAKAMNELGSNFTYRQLFSKIQAIMNVITPNQRPTLEGDVDFTLFKGEYVTQQPYYELSDILRPNHVKIQAGMLNGLNKNTTIYLLPAGTTNVDKDAIITEGIIINAKYNESTIRLITPLKDSNEKKYWLFVNEKTYGDMNLKVYFDKLNTQEPFEKDVKKYLSATNLGEVIIDSLGADLIIRKKSTNKIQLLIAKNQLQLEEFNASDSSTLETIKKSLFNFAQGQYLKNLSLKNKTYEFRFKLVRMENDSLNPKLKLSETNISKLDESITFKVRPELDTVQLELTNYSKKPLYINIVEINSKGEIFPFFPYPDCDLSNDDRRLLPGETRIIKTCEYNFSAPFERLMLKGFATPEPLNIQPTIQSRGNTNNQSNTNPLATLIGKTYLKNRGSSGQNKSTNIDGYSAEFIYEIVRE